jgi:hypothetical protein
VPLLEPPAYILCHPSRYPRLVIPALLVLFTAAVVFGAPAAAQATVFPVAIDVEGKHLTLAPADADAFQRRFHRPPQLDEPPAAATGPSYTVTTDYWDEAIREEDADPAVEPKAEYFPAGGFVRARQDGEDVWLVLDLRQRAILDHYVLYGTTQRLPANAASRQAVLNPSALLIAFLAYYGQGETIAIELGDRLLTDEEARDFLSSIAPELLNVTFVDPPQPPQTDDWMGYWVTITLPEGRDLLYFLDTRRALLIDALGTELYDLSTAAGGGIPPSAETLAVEQQDPAGSKLWWLLAPAGAAVLVAAALWTRRRRTAT